jgi:hypothetical protein
MRVKSVDVRVVGEALSERCRRAARCSHTRLRRRLSTFGYFTGGDMRITERLLGSFLNGVDSTLYAYGGNSSYPLYNQALKNLTFDVVLPGLPDFHVIAYVLVVRARVASRWCVAASLSRGTDVVCARC